MEPDLRVESKGSIEGKEGEGEVEGERRDVKEGKAKQDEEGWSGRW